MEVLTYRTFVLEPDEVKEAIMDFINKKHPVTCAELGETAITLDHGSLDDCMPFPRVIVKEEGAK